MNQRRNETITFVVLVVAVGESASSGTGRLHQVLEVTGSEVRACLTAFSIQSVLH